MKYLIIINYFRGKLDPPHIDNMIRNYNIRGYNL